jgi:hypothetical protein
MQHLMQIRLHVSSFHLSERIDNENNENKKAEKQGDVQ